MPLHDSHFDATVLGFAGGLPFTGLDLILLAGGSAVFAAAGLVANSLIGRLSRFDHARQRSKLGERQRLGNALERFSPSDSSGAG
jgi:hypothetical protein